ncbi:MAG: TPM domain-containing protein [Verrucomicrobiaceae bacterium]|nr:TPM domain-containing protein [Verrucomicrobiaceae bacterium]
MHSLRTICAALLLTSAFFTSHAAETPLVKPQRFFNDYTRAVRPAEADQLNEKLAQFERDSSNQLLVAIYSRMLTDSSIEDYCTRAFESWGVGQKDKDNGAVLFVFTQDRKMRIQTGYGLEASLTDAECHRIIEAMKPFFRSGNYTGGASLAVDAMITATKGEYKGTGRTVAEQKAGKDYTAIYLILGIMGLYVFAVWLNKRRQQSLGGVLYGPDGRRILHPSWSNNNDWSIGNTSWNSSGTSWDTSASSSWSDGGGSTGGGGASGDW